MVPRTGVLCSARPDYSNDHKRCKLAVSFLPEPAHLCAHEEAVGPGHQPGGQSLAGKCAGKGVIRLTFWQKCVWLGAALVIVVSLLMITRTAETSSPAPPATNNQPDYFTFQDTSRSETHYAVRDGDRAVIYNSLPTGR
jgi:hypothetical protein